MKEWYDSKLVWIHVINTLQGTGELVIGVLQKQAALDVIGGIQLGLGILGIIIRVWFTDTVINTAKARRKLDQTTGQ